MANGQRGHPFPTRVHERIGTDEQRTGPTLDELCKGRLDVAIAAGFNNNQLLSDRIRRGLHISSLPLGFRSVRVHDHRNRGCLRHQAGAAAPAASSLAGQRKSSRLSRCRPVG